MYQFHVNDNDIQYSILVEIVSCSGVSPVPEVVAKSYAHELNDVSNGIEHLFTNSIRYPVYIVCENEDRRGKEVIIFNVESLGYFISYDGIIRHYGVDSDAAIRALSMYL